MKEKRMVSTFFLICFMLTLGVFSTSCKKESEKQISPEIPPLAVSEIDIQKIESSTGLQFAVLKTQTVGYMPCHRFYWVCLDKQASPQQIESLAQTIINEAIGNCPKNYHSFMIHFFLKSELGETVENSESFAQATYLPEGSRQKIRKTAVDNYDDYILTCTFFDETI